MHDWTLKGIKFDWAAGCVTIAFEDEAGAKKSLIAEDVLDLHVPNANEWGPSLSVNEVSEIELMPSGLHQLRIEMQSADVIQIVAWRFVLPSS